MRLQSTFIGLAFLATAFSSCSEDDTFKVEEPIGAVINVDMGGDAQDHQVYINLNDSVTTRVANNSWDLALSNGSEFVAKINYAAGAEAATTGINDWSELTSEAIEAAVAMLPGGYQTMEGHVDNPSEFITDTAIPAISSTASDNEIFVIKQNSSATSWALVQVLQENGGYKVITASTDAFDTQEMYTVEKDAMYNFSYVSFESGAVSVEPAKGDWDIAFTQTTARQEGVAVAYKDYIIQNQGVKVALIDELETSVDFASFTEVDLETLNPEFSSSRTTIGSSWRVFDFSTYTYTITPNQFYLIEDLDGNVVKMRITAMLNTEGERGYQQFEYTELQ
ncbi:HmuY family protein [Sediminitomix flava]|uniref:Heme-binding HmuY-like protein n=1 Tax=Sediminitomix flava TaxID=379075 RepID=A0A315ZHW2_SEDFL|nr:HmuY family protein [Sediminitomix flava]PWJ44304.1 heme-binding HmuY-like protein [Sediminitomix flava]